jgi:hypothetical protein
MEAGQYSAAIDAIKEIGILTGMTLSAHNVGRRVS